MRVKVCLMFAVLLTVLGNLRRLKARVKGFKGTSLSTLLTVSLMVLAISLLSAGSISAAPEGLTPRTPIYIEGNDDFTVANGVVAGSGTENDPYIIENWKINAGNANGIWIGNTTAHFIVRNCLVENAYPGDYYLYYGILLEDVVNGRIENNTISKNNFTGIYLFDSSNNTLSNNTCENNGISIDISWSSSNTLSSNTFSNNFIGIRLYSSSNNTISNNIVENSSSHGIYSNSSSGNTLSNNTCSNDSDGIILISSSGNTLSNNTCSNDDNNGILIQYSDNNLISNNVVENNYYGISLHYSSDNNLIHHNNFVSNATQARDEGSNYWDNGYPSGGNYWSDYTGADNYHGENQDIHGSDGIGDTPYSIAGGANQDRYPLMNPWSLGLVSRPPILIESNENFTPANGVVAGSGTVGDPYIIENWIISAENDNGIEIRNTAAYFIIRNCLVENGGGMYGKGGIHLYCVTNGKIENCTSRHNSYGISLWYSSNNTLSNNTCSNNWHFGIDISGSNNTLIKNNTCSNNKNAGIRIDGSSNNTLSNNICSNNFHGIFIHGSSNSTLDNNLMENNARNFRVWGSNLSDFLHDIDTSNLVNGKPVRYLIDNHDEVIEPSLSIGYLALVGCENIRVENLVLNNNNGEGVLLAFTENSRVENCVFSKNCFGIFLASSSNNTLSNNTCSINDRGIYIYYSSNNTLTNNTSSNNYYGIHLSSSSNNTLTNNTCSNNKDAGIHLYSSNNNNILSNTFNNNGDIYSYAFSKGYGIFLTGSSYNTLTNNTCSNNYYYGIYLQETYVTDYPSDNNHIYHNNFIHNNFLINGPQALDSCSNYWDNGYPSGGNYWSDYTGADNYQGENQDILGSDGIGDTPYGFIVGAAIDRYPLMNPVGADTTPPLAPALILPADGSTTSDNTPAFDWSDVTDPSGVTYTLEIIGTLTKTGLTASTYTLTSAEALADGTYSWHVRAVDGAGNVGEWSTTWSLTIETEVLPNQPPNQPANLLQFKSDRVTVIPEEGVTLESTVVFKGTVSDPDEDQVRLEIELRQMDEAFTGEPTPETISSFVDSGTEVTITRYGLVNADYHWQYRAKDSKGNTSDWVEFGIQGNTDFTVSLPEGPYIYSINPKSGAPGIEITITGRNFSPHFLRPRVHFGSMLGWPFAEGTVIRYTDSEIVVKVPHGEGRAMVSVSVDSQTSNEVPFTYYKPLIESLTPSFGIPGTEVIIEGKNFGFRGNWPYDPYCYVKFGKSLAEIISWEDNKIVVKAPSDYGTGTNDAKFLTKIISFATGGSWGKVIGILTDLFIPGVALAPSEDGIVEDVIVATAAGISNKATFTWKMTVNVEASYLCSPGEMRVYDSQHNVTGWVNGKIKEEIPHSHCYENGVIIFYPTDSYRYEVVGTDEGSYSVTVIKVTKQECITFIATDISTSANATHQYTIDWDALSRGEEGATIQIDADGDGEFERSGTTDNELTSDEFNKITHPPLKLISGIVAVIALIGLILVIVKR